MRNLTNRKYRYIEALLASTALVSAGLTYGQDDTGSEPANASVEESQEALEEIVVRGVARKYRPDDQTSATGLNMRLIDTPQAISVLTPEMLNTVGALSVYDATDLVPGVQRGGFGFDLQRILMRGVLLTQHRINGLLSPASGVAAHSYMAERIEVVRGPATVLYGVTGSFGGEINTILKRPGRPGEGLPQQLGIEGEAKYGSVNYRLDVNGAVPGTDGALNVRLVGAYDDINLPYDIKNANPEHKEVNWLGSVAWDISPNTTATIWVQEFDREMDPVDGGALVQLPDGRLELPHVAFPDRVDPDTWYFAHPDQGIADAELTFVEGELSHQLDNDWQFKLNAAWTRFDRHISEFTAFGPIGGYALGDDEVYIYNYDEDRSLTDLTFNASLGGDVELFGREHSFFAAFEFVDALDPDTRRILNSTAMGIATLDFFADDVYDGIQPRFVDGSPFVPIDHEALGLRAIRELTHRDYKGSIQVLLRPTDRLEILGGLLFHNNESELVLPFQQGMVLDPPLVSNTSFDKVLPRLGITYDLVDEWGVMDDARAYFSYSEGFEPQTIRDAQGNATIIPQEMEAFEYGLKAEFFDGAVGASAAYFESKIVNIAASTTTIGEFGNVNTILGGTQDTSGLEVEMLGELLPGWNVAFNYAYTDAEIADRQAFDFTTKPRSVPKNTGAIITSYEFLDGPMRGLRLGGTFKVSSDYSYMDSLTLIDRFRANDGSPGTLFGGSHERLDLHMSYEGFSGSLEGLRLFASYQNVLDEKIFVSKESHPGFGKMFMDRPLIKIGASYSFSIND